MSQLRHIRTLDLFASLVLVITYGAFAIPEFFITFPEDSHRILVLAGYVYLAPVFMVLWSRLRLQPIMGRLASRPLREELSLTFLSPRDWLRERLFPPALSAQAPVLSVWPLYLIVLLFTGEPDEYLFETLWALAPLPSILLTICGCLHDIWLQCETRPKPAPRVLINIVWILIPPLFFPLQLVMANMGISSIRFILILLLILVGLTIPILLTRVLWNKLLRDYYRFE